MRALVVEARDEGVERLLLLQEVKNKKIKKERPQGPPWRNADPDTPDPPLCGDPNKKISKDRIMEQLG